MTSLKWSNYVSKFDGSDKIYLFKTITETLYTLKPEEYSIIDSYINGKNVVLSQQTKLHISELYVDGILVDKKIDEVKIFKDSFKEKMQNSTNGVLYFAPSFKCNLRCCYCIIGKSVESSNESAFPEMSETDVIQTAKWTYDMCNYHNIKKLKVILYGGEPMLSHKNNTLFIRTLNNLVHENSEKVILNYMVITNGFKLNQEDMLELIRLGVQTAQITLDGPPDIHNNRRYGVNKEKTFDLILQNLIFVAAHFDNTAIRINVDNKNASHINELIDILYQNELQKKCILHFNLVDPSDYSDDSGYNDKTITQFLSIYNYAFSKDFNIAPWRRYCSMSSKFYFAVDPEGYIYKCSNYLGEKNKSIGDIYSGVPNDNMFGILEERCYQCKYVGVCNGGCKVMRETSKIGADYCFSKENHAMAQAYYEALSNPEIMEKYHIKRLIR